MGWVAPSMAVGDGTIDCDSDSVAVCAARWSHMACGDGMLYAIIIKCMDFVMVALILSGWDG